MHPGVHYSGRRWRIGRSCALLAGRARARGRAPPRPRPRRLPAGLHGRRGSFHAHIVLSDLAVLACLAAAAVVAVRDGVRALAGRPLGLDRARPPARARRRRLLLPARGSDPYPWHEHLVTAAKYVEYALLAPAAVLLVRRRADLDPDRRDARRLERGRRPRSASSSSSAGGSSKGWPAGYRQPSFLGHHDFAALSGVTLGGRAGRDRAAGVADRPAAGRSRAERRASSGSSSPARSQARSGSLAAGGASPRSSRGDRCGAPG